MPMITDAMMIASAVFWSSSISLRSEKGVTFTMMKNAIAKRRMPSALNASARDQRFHRHRLSG